MERILPPSTSNMKKYPYIVVIGRIPEDDEDSVYMYTNLTEEEAREEFVKSIYADGPHEETPESVEEQWGVSCYINCILASESEIKGLAYSY